MIAVDTSAIVAIALGDPERRTSSGSSNALKRLSSAPYRPSRRVWSFMAGAVNARSFY
jgi:hypothetical protein